MTRHVVVIGAGPYGLAISAHLRHAGVDVHTFGDPMVSWRAHMPKGMLLRGRRRSSHLPDPEHRLSIDDYEAATGKRLADPIPLDDFVAYAAWFQEQAVPDVDRRSVVHVGRSGDQFAVELEDGSTIDATHVVVASGLRPFARRPVAFRELPPAFVSHTTDHDDLRHFGGTRLVVIGGGQSALETATIAAEAGADVELIARAPALKWLPERTPARAKVRAALIPPTDLGGWRSAWVAAAPGVLHRLPAAWQVGVYRRCVSPAGASWLRPRFDRVRLTAGRTVTGATVEDGAVVLRLDDGSERRADHVLLGTGFEVEIARYDFLDRSIVDAVDVVDGSPVLSDGYESSVPRLYFAGATAAHSFGPVTQFVVGSWHAAPAITRHVLGRPARRLAMSYRPRIRRRRAPVSA